VGPMKEIGGGPVGLDTVVFIYFIEEHPQYLALVEPVFTAIDTGTLEGVTSGLTLLETLVVPYRTGNLPLAQQYEAILTRSRGIRMLDFDRPLLRAAAQLRAGLRIRTPDALQIAAALDGHCSVYLTNDRALPSIPGLKCLQLRDYLPTR